MNRRDDFPQAGFDRFGEGEIEPRLVKVPGQSLVDVDGVDSA